MLLGSLRSRDVRRGPSSEVRGEGEGRLASMLERGVRGVAVQVEFGKNKLFEKTKEIIFHKVLCDDQALSSAMGIQLVQGPHRGDCLLFL